MRLTRRIGLAIGLLVTIFAFGVIFRETTDKRRLPVEANVEVDSFALTSPVLANNEPMPPLYTCKGQNTRPPLAIQRPPVGTESLAVIMRDPDAVNGEWTHWIAWNIDSATTNLDETALPTGAVEGMTSFGKPGYGGPCPPAGTGVHRYVFELFALDQVLTLAAPADRRQLEEAMKGHILAQTRLTASFDADK